MAVQLVNLAKRYVGPDGSVVPVVDIERLDLADGEQVALVGASGSGKTTLLHLIAGILTPERGSVVLNGTDVANLSEPARDVFRGANVGYIFQTHHLLPGFTALENVLLGMSFTGRAPDRAWAVHLLERVGLLDRLNYKPARLSVGQQQRVAVARALANRPKLVLADEPTGALDENNAKQVLQLIRELCVQVNASLLLVTHDMDIANQFSRVVNLKDLNHSPRMNLLQLILKQMRQRALSTWLTLLSVLLGVGLATAVLIIYRGGGAIFGQTEFGYDILVGPPKGSPLQLVMNTVYHIDQSPGLIPYTVYEDILKDRGNVRLAVPYAVGDSYKNHRIVGTLPKLFGVGEDGKPLAPERVLEYKIGKRYQLAQGQVFHAQKFEAVIGSEITQRTGLKLGDKFKATHGLPEPNQTPDEHDTQWTVVGVLEKTYTAADRVIFIPLTSFYAIKEHKDAMEQQAEMRRQIERATGKPIATPPKREEAQDRDHPATAKAADADDHDDHAHDHGDMPHHVRADGTIELHLPKNEWVLSAILVRSRGGPQALSLIWKYKVIDPSAVAVSPAVVMREFFDTFFSGSRKVLLVIALLVSVVASVSILVSIYNSVVARMREIAILRALGATRTRILLLICLEAALIGLIGGAIGLVVGHALGALGSAYMARTIGEGFDWLTIGPGELLYLGVVLAISLLAGLVPALKAYRVPVATNLVAT